MAKRWNISREAQDVLACESHRKLCDAYARGFVNDLMTPYRGLARDNNLRANLTLEKLASLEPVFDRDAGTLAKPLGAIDRAKLNENGSLLATGQPFAATGGRIVAGLAKMLAQLDKAEGSARGLISICAAGGQGVVAILER